MFIPFLLLLICQEGTNVEIDPSKTIIWGPGLKPDKITMRARYIFLQLIDLEGKKYGSLLLHKYIVIKCTEDDWNNWNCSRILKLKIWHNKLLEIFLSLTESPGKDLVTVRIQGETSKGHACLVWTQVLDSKDGSFIVRYKLHNTCFNFQLKVQIKEYNLPVLLVESKGMAKLLEIVLQTSYLLFT